MLTYSEEIARDVAVISTPIVNAYLIGHRDSWVLVDSGTPGSSSKIRRAAEERFGVGATPRAIVLTHGHSDHSGSAQALADGWGIRVHAHMLEFPYLTGRSSYPPLDPTAPGFFSGLSRFFPSHTANLASCLEQLDRKQPFPGLPDWECVDTPGHAPGHVSFFRHSDRTLIAGDAVTTMNLDTMIGVVTKEKKVDRPPVPATLDWQMARASVQRLAQLRPSLIGAGHGIPLRDSAEELQQLADHFRIPSHGRYVREPARADETGVTYLPPAPPDPAPRMAAGIAAGLLIFAAGLFLTKSTSSGE